MAGPKRWKMNCPNISRWAVRTLAILPLLAMALRGEDVAAVKAEANLDRRAAISLDAIDTAITQARTALDEGRAETYRQALADIRELADVNWQAQEVEAGHRNSRRLKSSEQRLRPLLRRLESLVQAASLEDRKAAEAVQLHVQELQDKIVAALFAPKKKKS